MDYSILSWISRTFANSKAIAVIAKIFSEIGGTWGVIAISLILLCFKKTRKIGFFVMIAGGFTAVLNDIVIKNMVKRDRPFETYPELVNMCELAKYEFPDGYSMASGHSAVSMAMAVAVVFFSKKWGCVSIALSILIGLSRLVLCVHYPTDVLVGWVLGVTLGIAMHYLTILGLKIINKIWGNKNEKNSTSNEKQEQN